MIFAELIGALIFTNDMPVCRNQCTVASIIASASSARLTPEQTPSRSGF
jgi:hypothetical protein